MGHCDTCAWWQADSTKFRGACHGGPPTADPINDRALWPITQAHEFCGAYRLRETLCGGRDARVTA